MTTSNKYTLFIRDKDARWKGVKSRKEYAALIELADTEYLYYTASGRAFISDNTGRIIHDYSKHGR